MSTLPPERVVRCIHCQAAMVLNADGTLPPHRYWLGRERHRVLPEIPVCVPCKFSGSKSYEEVREKRK